MADKPKSKPIPSYPPPCKTCNGTKGWFVNGQFVICTACS